jgi:pyruvate/2-oxoglutarate dehydrogenase complex dihydrolipoamide acyltransferase (E2) component
LSVHRIRVPSLAENVEEATVGEWRVAEGEPVEPGQEVVELVTEKAEFTLEAEEEVRGTLLARLAEPKSVLPVGYVLAVVGEEAERDALEDVRDENAALLARRANAATSTISAVAAEPAAAPAAAGGRVRATPAARRLARELGLDLPTVAAAMEVKGALKEEHVRAFVDRSRS